MKKNMAAEDKRDSLVSADLITIKTITRLFNQEGLNMHLKNPHLIQEIKTLFFTTFSLVESFLKCADNFAKVMSNMNADRVILEYEKLQMDPSQNEYRRFPVLNAL